MSVTKLVGPRRQNESGRKHSAEQYKNYLEAKKCDDLEIHYNNCTRDWDQDFAAIAASFDKLNNNLALEFVESWSPEETQQVGKEELFRRGVENASKAFPDHSFVVVPHINPNGCFHTHVLFATVSDKGQRLYDKGVNRNRWNRVCDTTSREHGLSTVQRKSSTLKEKLSRAAIKQSRRGQQPYQLSMMQKADFARRMSINMDEFISFMDGMGITVNDRGKSISYFHESRQKATRGRKLGLNYTKGELSEQFNRNKEEFINRPDLRKYLLQIQSSLINERGDIVGDTSNFPFLTGGHQKFKNEAEQLSKMAQVHSKNDSYGDAHSANLYDHLNGQIKVASGKNIAEYCRNQGIELTTNKDGSHRLKGREHILIKGSKWENTKQKNGQKIGTTGSLLEFVANHKDTTYLGALSEISGNPKILLLEKYLGKVERNYKEFHIPKSKRKDKEPAMKLLRSLTKQLGQKSDLSRFLFNMKQIQVGVDNSIRILIGDDAKGAVKYTQGKDSKWSKSFLGSLKGGVLSQKGRGKKLKLFKDTFSFMESSNGKGKNAFSRTDSILVLGGGDMEALDFFLATNPQVQDIELFGFDQKSVTKDKSQELQKRGLTLTFLETGGKQRNRSLDLSL